LSNRQIATLKQLAICCANGRPAGLTRDQREAMVPLWRKEIVEIWYRHFPADRSWPGADPFHPRSKEGQRRMSKSSIEWTTETWNPVVGCSILTPGCTHCYAMGMAARIEAINAALVADGKPMASPQYAGTTKKVNGHAVWTGKLALAGDNILLQPLKRKKPTTYFVNSMGDLFHKDAKRWWIDRTFAVMALTPWHTYQILTKRAEEMRDYFADPRRHNAIELAAEQIKRGPEQFGGKHVLPRLPLPNVWLGISAERQQEWDERKEHLRETPAAVHFASFEPLLGPIVEPRPISDFLQWAIVGGERGPRPMHPDWARSLKVQCEAAGVPFFFKQWGSHAPSQMAGGAAGLALDSDKMVACNKKAAGRALDGIEYNAMPVPR
jgi:protein gp37